ncbi:MAG: primosomal protein N' [Candidatus Taylorbacteria bacterium]|nr:primosomal protein N' [Candidatus Taylorbacteria bacterium]
MKIVKVIPLMRAAAKETLTYWSMNNLKEGSLVEAPLRGKNRLAMVISTEDLPAVKSELKAMPYALKKIGKTVGESFLSQSFISAARETARYFVSTTGAVLECVTSEAVRESAGELRAPAGVQKEKKVSPEKLALQAGEEERFNIYRSLIREEFARGRSVYLCLPTIEDIVRAARELPKGIEKFTFILHSRLSKKTLLERWQAAAREKHPVLVLGTGAFLALPRSDLETIVIERESTSAWKIPRRPFVDLRTFAEFLCERSGARLIFGDVLLRTELIHRLKQGELLEFSPLKLRASRVAREEVVDMRSKAAADGSFATLSEELKRLIVETKESNDHLFILAARRGLAPETICLDCGSFIACPRCSAPMILHDSPRRFLCHKCAETRPAEARCARCGSWNLKAYGVGIERVEAEIRQNFKNIKLFVINKDRTGSAEAAETAAAWQDSPGGVLLGTEMTLSYLSPVGSAAAVSLDSLFALPDFRTNEKILNILFRLKQMAQKNFLIQTRQPEQKVFDYALKGNLTDFYRQELAERKTFEYPPFSTLIKVTRSGKRERVKEEMGKLSAALAGEDFVIFPAFIHTVKGKYVMHCLLKLREGRWIDEKLFGKLASLPLSFTVNVNPESLL